MTQDAPTFFWHDYETFGRVPRMDRPAQFAGIRTDAGLREIAAPVVWHCQPARDYLPDPEACLLTGITPQHCQQHGLPEHLFAAHIAQQLGQPGTIGVGYNSIRFDDEVTRFLFWRNLMDPYAHSYKNGCSRWDLLDVLRMQRALRPQGMAWPEKADGRADFSLQGLARANDLAQGHAHDALGDVRTLLALARRVRGLQPRLFDFALGLRSKARVLQEMGLERGWQRPGQGQPFLHISGMLPAERGCLAILYPLAVRPGNANEVLCWDLAHDPRLLPDLGAEEIRQRLFVRAADLPGGVSRLPIKGVHINRSPMVVGKLQTLTPQMAAQWGLDVDQCLRHAGHASRLPDMSATWVAVCAPPDAREAPDVDQDLYAAFPGDQDRRRLERLRQLAPEELALDGSGFDDPRLPELVFRYRARNFPHSLTAQEQRRWQLHCHARLVQGQGGARTATQLFAEVDRLAEVAGPDERAEGILGQLYEWAEVLLPDEDMGD